MMDARSSLGTAGRLAAILLLATLFGCTSLTIELPAVTKAPTDVRTPGKVIWHDLLTNDIEASKAFYASLFGWEYEELPLSLGIGRSSRYALISHQGHLIGGMVDVSDLGERVNSSQWIAIMSVDDVEQAARAVAAAGGTVMTPPTDLADRGRMAVAQDPDGAVFGLLETLEGDPPDREAGFGEFLWNEVWVKDSVVATNFYSRIAPFEPMDIEGARVTFTGLAVGGKPRLGILQEPVEGLDPTWVSYIRVQDMSLLDKVEGAGGTVLLPAEDRDIGGQVALVAGPSGAGVALQTWPPEEERVK